MRRNDDAVLAHIDSRWHSDFRKFVDTGEASDAFIEYMDTNEDCQRALELSLAAESASLKKLAQSLPSPSPEPDVSQRGGALVRLANRAMASARPFALTAAAAALLIALAAGIVAWGIGSVAQQDEHRLLDLRKQHAAVVARNDALRNENAQLRVQFARLSTTYRDMAATSQQAMLTQAQPNQSLSPDRVAKLTRDLLAVRESEAIYHNQVEDLNSERDKVAQTLSVAHAESAALKEKITSLSSERDKLAQALSAEQAENANLSDERDRATHDLYTTQATLQAYVAARPITYRATLKRIDRVREITQGQLEVGAHIKEDGRVDQTQVIDPDAGALLNVRAVAALRNAKFEPALTCTVQCTPQSTWEKVTFTAEGFAHVKGAQPASATATGPGAPPPG
jgi:regulator of replication initiation timing